jgi:predicted TIM-barrel enzyme
MLVDGKVKDVFKKDKFLIGMIHLFGKTRADSILTAIREIDIYIENGFDAVLIEDYFREYTVVMEVLAYLKRERKKIIYGVNILCDYRKGQEVVPNYKIS